MVDLWRSEGERPVQFFAGCIPCTIFFGAQGAAYAIQTILDGSEFLSGYTPAIHPCG